MSDWYTLTSHKPGGVQGVTDEMVQAAISHDPENIRVYKNRIPVYYVAECQNDAFPRPVNRLTYWAPCGIPHPVILQRSEVLLPLDPEALKEMLPPVTVEQVPSTGSWRTEFDKLDRLFGIAVSALEEYANERNWTEAHYKDNPETSLNFWDHNNGSEGPDLAKEALEKLK